MTSQGAELDLALVRRDLIEHHRRHGFKDS